MPKYKMNVRRIVEETNTVIVEAKSVEAAEKLAERGPDASHSNAPISVAYEKVEGDWKPEHTAYEVTDCAVEE